MLSRPKAKVTDARMVLCPETFQPKLLATFSVPYELIQDNAALRPEENQRILAEFAADILSEASKMARERSMLGNI